MKQRLSMVDQHFATTSDSRGSSLGKGVRAFKWHRYLDKLVIVGGTEDTGIEDISDLPAVVEQAVKEPKYKHDYKFTTVQGQRVPLCMDCVNIGNEICHICERVYCFKHWPSAVLRQGEQICKVCIAERQLGGKE